MRYLVEASAYLNYMHLLFNFLIISYHLTNDTSQVNLYSTDFGILSEYNNLVSESCKGDVWL